MRRIIPFMYLAVIASGVLLTELVGQTAAIRDIASTSSAQSSYLSVMLPESDKLTASRGPAAVEIPSRDEIARQCHDFYQSCTKGCKVCEPSAPPSATCAWPPRLRSASNFVKIN